MSLFPDEQHILDAGHDDARLNFGTLMNDDNFRKDCANYTENIAQGRHDPEWLASAWAAHERRKVGDFDQYLLDVFENDWEVELPDDARPRRGELQVNDASDQESDQNGQADNDNDQEPLEDEEARHAELTHAEVDEVDHGVLAAAEYASPGSKDEPIEQTIVVKTTRDIDELQGDMSKSKSKGARFAKRRVPGVRMSSVAEESEDELA